MRSPVLQYSIGHVSLGSSWLWQSLKFPLFLMILTDLSSTGQNGPQFVWGFSHDYTGVMGLGEEDCRGKVSFHGVTPRVYTAHMIHHY